MPSPPGLRPCCTICVRPTLDTLRRELARFATEDRSIKVLLRPASATTAEAFYFVATAPPISPEQTEGELQQLLRLGILPGLSQGCAARLLRDREASLLDNGAEVLTSVTSVEGAAGCWAVVIATGERHVLGAIEARPYWSRQEVRIAIAIYVLMAILIAAIFAGVWTDLLRFRRLALSPTQHAGFARTTGIPELAPLAAAFDSMVQRMKRSADMLRQAAEDNAHAFKGPIGTIRQAIEQPLRQALSRDQALHDSLRTVSSALDRLDGLVQSARYLDGAAAELLEPQLSQVDLSALARAFVRSYGTMNAARQVRLDVQIADGIGVTGQPETLETILETVVDNARQFLTFRWAGIGSGRAGRRHSDRVGGGRRTRRCTGSLGSHLQPLLYASPAGFAALRSCDRRSALRHWTLAGQAICTRVGRHDQRVQSATARPVRNGCFAHGGTTLPRWAGGGNSA